MSAVPRRSPMAYRLFFGYAKRYLRRHFSALRLARGCRPALPDGPLLFVLNHPSWWDPLFGMVLAEAVTPREMYAPIDAAGLARFPVLERMGLFGIEMNSVAGARRFLDVGSQILDRPDAFLAVTVQGEFTDPRVRPVAIMPGVGHLVARRTTGTIVPTAIEYPFWNERLPEALAELGTPIPMTGGASAAAWTARIAEGLEATQDSLAEKARRRDPAAFETLAEGGKGMASVYGPWRWLRHRLRPAGGPS